MGLEDPQYVRVHPVQVFLSKFVVCGNQVLPLALATKLFRFVRKHRDVLQNERSEVELYSRGSARTSRHALAKSEAACCLGNTFHTAGCGDSSLFMAFAQGDRRTTGSERLTACYTAGSPVRWREKDTEADFKL